MFHILILRFHVMNTKFSLYIFGYSLLDLNSTLSKNVLINNFLVEISYFCSKSCFFSGQRVI